LQHVVGARAGIVDVDDSEGDFAAALAMMRGRDPEGDAEEVGAYRTAGVVMVPGSAQCEENILCEIFHICGWGAEALQRSIDVIELLLKRV
jgi:hypothetical protein